MLRKSRTRGSRRRNEWAATSSHFHHAYMMPLPTSLLLLPSPKPRAPRETGGSSWAAAAAQSQAVDLPPDFAGDLQLSVHLAEPDSTIRYWPDFIPEAEADALFGQLLQQIDWRRRDNRMQGQLHQEPRLSSWFGVPYTYSGVPLTVNPDWPPVLAELRDRLADMLRARLNSVGCVLYRSGQDSIGWHADDEPCLGRYPLIASISLGCDRQFELMLRDEPSTNCRLRGVNPWGRHLRMTLGHGSLLVMQGSIQRHWLHAVHKDPGLTPEDQNDAVRINLAFRFVFNR